MMVYNMMTCESSNGSWTLSILGGCSQAWLVAVLIFFLVLVLRRQCEDGVFAGTGFNFWGAVLIGLGASIILTTFTGEARWAFLAGLVGVGVGGFGLGQIFDTTGGEDG